MSDAQDDAAECIRDLFEALDMLGQCQGNKAKLEIAECAVGYYLELQQICALNKFTVAVGATEDSETVKDIN